MTNKSGLFLPLSQQRTTAGDLLSVRGSAGRIRRDRTRRPPSATRYGVGPVALRHCRGNCAICGWLWGRLGISPAAAGGSFAPCAGRPGALPPGPLRFFEKNRVKLFMFSAVNATLTPQTFRTTGNGPMPGKHRAVSLEKRKRKKRGVTRTVSRGGSSRFGWCQYTVQI